jgi:hypothetical protein
MIAVPQSFRHRQTGIRYCRGADSPPPSLLKVVRYGRAKLAPPSRWAPCTEVRGVGDSSAPLSGLTLVEIFSHRVSRANVRDTPKSGRCSAGHVVWSRGVPGGYERRSRPQPAGLVVRSPAGGDHGSAGHGPPLGSYRCAASSASCVRASRCQKRFALGILVHFLPHQHRVGTGRRAPAPADSNAGRASRRLTESFLSPGNRRRKSRPEDAALRVVAHPAIPVGRLRPAVGDVRWWVDPGHCHPPFQRGYQDDGITFRHQVPGRAAQ